MMVRENRTKHVSYTITLGSNIGAIAGTSGAQTYINGEIEAIRWQSSDIGANGSLFVFTSGGALVTGEELIGYITGLGSAATPSTYNIRKSPVLGISGAAITNAYSKIRMANDVKVTFSGAQSTGTKTGYVDIFYV